MSAIQPVLLSLLMLTTASLAVAQSTEQRPDARYSKPSGQDSQPSTTEVKPTKPAPPSKTPQDSSRGAAAPNTYVTGKKPDVAGGCSTPTDARSAGVDKRGAQNNDKTVCTNSGEGSQSATKPKQDPSKK